MSSRHPKVVVNDRKRRHDVVDQALAAVPSFPLGQLNANLQLRHGYGGNGNVIVVIDDVVKVRIRLLRVNEEGRVK